MIVEEIKEEIVSQITEIKEDISFEPKKSKDGFKLLIGLMKYLRDNHNNKLLMVCRQIQKIEIIKNQVSLIAEENVLDEIFQNNEFCSTLELFFKNENLSLKCNNQNEDVQVVKQLKKWLGDKLIVK